MFDSTQYELLDFGTNESGVGEKLERFGDILVARPSPPADSKTKKSPAIWAEADAWFRLNAPASRTGEKAGKWDFSKTLAVDDSWTIQHLDYCFQIKPTPFGHLGVFAEQQTNWDWIDRKIRSAKREVNVLNLFAYTGGSTMAAAAAGAKVTHIDSAKNVVNWARENARLSGLEDAPVRWIAEDGSLFVEREIKRKKKYDAVILDPPSFGHGPKGEVWKIDRDLMKLLRNCRKLLSDDPLFFLLSCHSPGMGTAELHAALCDSIFGTCSVQVAAESLSLKTAEGRKLNAGYLARWPKF